MKASDTVIGDDINELMLTSLFCDGEKMYAQNSAHRRKEFLLSRRLFLCLLLLVWLGSEPEQVLLSGMVMTLLIAIRRDDSGCTYGSQ